MVQAASRPVWSSRAVFLLAAIGASVGLGNIWKFPYTAGISGGAAFVVVYVLAIAFVAIPIVMAELMIGRRGRASPVGSFDRLAGEAERSGAWRWVGWLNVTAVFAIMSFYSVIGGWALAYVPKLAFGAFTGAGPAEVAAVFDGLLASPLSVALWHAAFMAITAVIVTGGLEAGIERAVRFLMPSLFAMLLVLLAYGAATGGFLDAVHFLFAPDFSRLDGGVALAAVGQAFFSVGVAMGLTITYGSYMRPEESILRSAVVIAGADTLVALLAGLAIFPLVFANGLDPAEGPGLIFVTLPIAFGRMPAGALFGAVFFVLIVFAALTSSIAILETIISPFVDRDGARRVRVAWWAAAAAWLLGLATVFSFNLWSDLRPLGFLDRFTDATVFDVLDHVASNLMLPLGGILIAVFAGWVVAERHTLEELRLPARGSYRVWRGLIRFVAPLLVAAILLASVR